MSTKLDSLKKFYGSQIKLIKAIIGPFILSLILLIIMLVLWLVNGGDKTFIDFIQNNSGEHKVLYQVFGIITSIALIVYSILTMVYAIIGLIKSIFCRGAGMYKIFYVTFSILGLLLIPTLITAIINAILCKINMSHVTD